MPSPGLIGTTLRYLGHIPAYLVYDNACNLRAFCKNLKNRKTISANGVVYSISGILDNIHYVVDRLHIQGHKDPICLATCNPAKFPDLEGKNTMVCEQTNFWAGKYKFQLII